MIRLGVNIDHVATIRNARGGEHPCPVQAALLAAQSGADGITAHLREDRRHIRDRDIERLKSEVSLPLNLEMAMTDEMLAIALRAKPHAVCIVPEKRQEITTEGGLDVAKIEKQITPFVQRLRDAGIRVSLFVAPLEKQIEAAARAGAQVVELHTGEYSHAFAHQQHAPQRYKEELSYLFLSDAYAHQLGLEVHAGHGLNYDNVAPIAALEHVAELNIGHFLIGEAIFEGLGQTVTKMRNLIQKARQ